MLLPFFVLRTVREWRPDWSFWCLYTLTVLSVLSGHHFRNGIFVGPLGSVGSRACAAHYSDVITISSNYHVHFNILTSTRNPDKQILSPICLSLDIQYTYVCLILTQPRTGHLITTFGNIWPEGNIIKG